MTALSLHFLICSTASLEKILGAIKIENGFRALDLEKAFLKSTYKVCDFTGKTGPATITPSLTISLSFKFAVFPGNGAAAQESH